MGIVNVQFQLYGCIYWCHFLFQTPTEFRIFVDKNDDKIWKQKLNLYFSIMNLSDSMTFNSVMIMLYAVYSNFKIKCIIKYRVLYFILLIIL